MKTFTVLTLLGFLSVNSMAQTSVASYSIQDVTTVATSDNITSGFNESGDYNKNTSYHNFYGQASGGGGGLERVIIKFTTGSGGSSLTFSPIPAKWRTSLRHCQHQEASSFRRGHIECVL